MSDSGTESASATDGLIELAVDSWRLSRLLLRVLAKLDAGEAGRYHSQLRYHVKRLEDTLKASGLTLVNLEGQPYDTGVAATALNIADFGADDVLVVDQMVEPIIMSASGVRRTGTLMLRKAIA
jgi:hypothetical protein